MSPTLSLHYEGPRDVPTAKIRPSEDGKHVAILNLSEEPGAIPLLCGLDDRAKALDFADYLSQLATAALTLADLTRITIGERDAA